MLTAARLVLYYPVSALVTLFANILQNHVNPPPSSPLSQFRIPTNTHAR